MRSCVDSPRGQTELYSVEDALRGQFEVMFSHPVVDGRLCSNLVPETEFPEFLTLAAGRLSFARG